MASSQHVSHLYFPLSHLTHNSPFPLYQIQTEEKENSVTGNAKKVEGVRAILENFVTAGDLRDGQRQEARGSPSHLGNSMGEWLCLWQTRLRRQIHRGSVCGSDRLGDFVALFVGLIV